MEVRGWFAGIAVALLLCGLAQPARGDVFRPFAADSPWNIPAASKGPIEPLNPYVAELGAPDLELAISGIPPQSDYAKPTFFADPGDPVTSTVTLTTDWSPNGDLKWDGGPIPVPAGSAPAPGSDGHLAIVSADRSTAWEFWRCTTFGPDGITAAVIAQWDLTGPGYSADIRENSARASGTPIVSTALRADEAIEGIDHALGLSVPAVSSDYLYPVASHSDGLLGPAAIRYGTLFVLRDDFPVPPEASIGERNVIEALKRYGAYVVDQGGIFELDADSNHPELWQQAGLTGTTLDILPQDLRLVRTPPSPLVFEAESMTRSTPTDAIRPLADPAASDGTAISFRQSPTWLTQVYSSEFPADLVTLRMRGDSCEGAPEALLSIDGLVTQAFEVTSTSYSDYTAALPALSGGLPGAHILKVEFPNNHVTQTCDRNLYLDKVTIRRFAPPPPDLTPPADPAALAATAGDGTVALAWDANGESDLDHYDVYRSTTAGGPYAQINTSPVATPSFDDSGLTNDTTYHYVVRAVDASGNASGDSNEAGATPVAPPPPPDLTPPEIPVGLAATAGNATVGLSWTANSEPDLDHYDLYRAVTPGGPYGLVNTAPLTTPSFDDAGLTNDTTYYYVVRAVDASSNASGDSSEVSATPVAPPPPPPSGYPRPKGATPLYAPLVPAYTDCTSPTGEHALPLNFGSCGPPAPLSPNLTLGTPDANAAPATGVGYVLLRALIQTAPTPSDVTIDAGLTDVRCTPAVGTCGMVNEQSGSDYTGELGLELGLQITDRLSGAGSGTVQAVPFAVTIPCSETASTATGASCSVSTSANSVLPGAVESGKRAIWELDRISVSDGGPDGAVATADNSPFQAQGLFVP